MPFLLGLKYLKSKEPLPNLPLQDTSTEEQPSPSGYGEPKLSEKKISASPSGYGKQTISETKSSAGANSLAAILTLHIHPDKHKLNVKPSTQDGYGVSRTKKTSSFRSKLKSASQYGYGVSKSSTEDGYGVSKSSNEDGYGVSSTMRTSSSHSKAKSSPEDGYGVSKSPTEDGYGVSSSIKKTSSSHSKLKSSIEDGYGVSSTDKTSSSSHSKVKSSTEDGYGVSSTKKSSSSRSKAEDGYGVSSSIKKTSSSHSKLKSSIEDGHGVSSTNKTSSSSHRKVNSSTEDGYGVSSTKKPSSSRSKVKSSTEDGYGVSSTNKASSSSHSKVNSSTEDGYGVSSTKKPSSSHSKVKKKGLPSAQIPVTRKNFSALKNVRKDETFTNNESLPDMDKAYRQFIRLYPEYLQTRIVDEIRAEEYAYLNESGHVCLDYSGYGLFSKWEETWHKASASFGLSYISVNLPIHALYGGPDKGTVEYDIKKMVSEFLNIQESEYAMVFTASRGSAFKLLGECYPFHLNKKLLSVYDYESEAVKWLEEAAQRRCAEVMSASFRWSSQRLWGTDLKKKLFEKKKNKKEPGKGLFVFPVQSRVTGAKYSYQWMSQAQENGWDILLDASALGPNAMGSLGLCVFQPDFIVSSFFKVYGSDPTGFGCLMIKRSAIGRLHSSSTARGVGMVRLLPIGQSKGCEIEETESATNTRFTERRQTVSTYAHSGPLQRASKAETYLARSEYLRATSAEPATVGDDQRFPSKCSVRTKLRRVQKNETLCSTSDMEARQPQPKMLTSVDEIKEIHSFDDYEEPEEVPNLESAYDLCQRNHHHQEVDQHYPGESTSSTGFDGLEENEASRSHVSPHDQLAIIMDEEDDSSFVYSEDASSAFFLDDEECEDASFPYQNDVDDVDDADDDDDGREFSVERKDHEIVCRGLEHANKLGLNGTNTRLRCLINWLIASMLKLRHPGSPDSQYLIQIYGPKVNYDRGASVAFNLFDWKGNLLQPLLVQRLADRSNISFGVTTLKNIHLPKSSASWANYLENLNNSSVGRGDPVEARYSGRSLSIEAITVGLCFLSNFEDVYRFWVFLANFLDADFVSKEVWRYRSLNQETVLLGEPSKSSGAIGL